MKNLIESGIREGYVFKTDMTKNLVIDGKQKTHPVHKIRIDMLYYNDQNDRIATWISRYKSEQGIKAMDMTDLEEYNLIMHNFITESNPDALRKTQKNIEMIGQQEPGVVLLDGRIIDGNRRFTCLRNIERNNGETQYFYGVILDGTTINEKEIKMLELMLQHGVDEKVGYDPIDRLVGVYHDVVETGLLSIEEYAQSINAKVNEVKVEIEKAKLMVEFLEFMKVPGQYHLARQFNINDPLKELNAMLRKVKEEEKQKLKTTVFSQFIVQPEGDATRYMRKIKNIASYKEHLNDYISEQSEIAKEVVDYIGEQEEVGEKEIAILRANDNVRGDFLASTEKYLDLVNSNITKNMPVRHVERAYDYLAEIDQRILVKLSIEQLDALQTNLTDLKEKIEEVEDSLIKAVAEK